MQKYFIVKYNRTNFLSGTVVKLIANTFNNCNLVENIDSKERIWLMTYDLYPIIDHNKFLDWSYNKNYQKLIPSTYYIVNNKNIVKLLNNNDLEYYIVLDIDTKQEMKINKNSLVKANDI